MSNNKKDTEATSASFYAPEAADEDKTSTSIEPSLAALGEVSSQLSDRPLSLPDEVAELLNLLPIESLDSNILGVRSIAETSGQVMFALAFVEMTDSFILLFPTGLISKDGNITGVPISKSTVIRKMKNGISHISIPSPELQFFYLRYLRGRVNEMPDFFNEERIQAMDAMLDKTVEESSALAKYGGTRPDNSNPTATAGDAYAEDEEVDFMGKRYKHINKTRH